MDHFQCDEVVNLIWINSLGLSVLASTLRSAALFVSRSNVNINKVRECHNSFVMVQGTGLKVLIDRFGLNYDAESIRDGFNYRFHIRS